MPVVSIFSGTYCLDEEVAAGVARTLKYRLIADEEVIAWAAGHCDLPEEKLRQAMHGQLSIFSRFTREKERAVAYLREAIAELALADNIVHRGFAGHLLPSDIAHVLKVCLVAGQEFRTARATGDSGQAKGKVKRRIQQEDLARSQWTAFLFQRGPWDRRLYDIKIPMHTTSVVDAVAMICDNARAAVVQSTPASRKAMEDFLLAARVNRALVEEGHDVEVTSRDGDVTVAINKYVLRLDHLREQFRKVGARVAGVKSVQVREQPDLRASLVMSNQEFDLPAKVLLIDDEKEFVQTLSERLQMRDIGTAVVFDGEQALSVIDREEPEVMILDLRMPGIDGIEVLLTHAKTMSPSTGDLVGIAHPTPALVGWAPPTITRWKQADITFAALNNRQNEESRRCVSHNDERHSPPGAGTAEIGTGVFRPDHGRRLTRSEQRAVDCG